MKNYPKFRIYYLDVNVVQEKHLISQESYDNLYSPTKRMIADLIQENSGKKNYASESLEAFLKRRFPDEFFTDKSPLFESISTGILNCNNYQSNVKINRL